MITTHTENQIKSVLTKAINNREFAGANILITKDSKEIFYHEDGLSSVADKTPIKRDTIFRLYSMTKPVTAVATMILFQRGEIDLYDPISNFIPEFKKQKVSVGSEFKTPTREINIKDLLNMTSGLLYPWIDVPGTSVDNIFKEMDSKLDTKEEVTTLEFANKMANSYLGFNPGEKWAYGTSADILGAVIEVVSGYSLGDFFYKEIFKPLGMVDTGFFVDPDKQSRVATVYETISKDEELKLYNGCNLAIKNICNSKPAFESGGAGLFSTVDDYNKFTTMLINSGSLNGVEILKPKTVDFLTSQQLTNRQHKNLEEWNTLGGYSYGNLMRVMTNPELAGGLVRLGEYGWDGWLGCYMANFPTEKLTILVMMQKKDGGTTSFTRKLRNLILQEF